MLTPPSSPSSSPPVLTYAVEVYPAEQFNRYSFRLQNEACTFLYEFISNAYEHFEHKLKDLLQLKYSFKVIMIFDGCFTENREIGFGNFDEVQYQLNHCTIPQWVYDSFDIAQCYDSFKRGLFEKVAEFIPFARTSQLQINVYISDLEDFFS